MNIGLVFLHVFLGLALAAHGFQKLIVFKLSGLTAYLAGLGFRVPGLLAVAVIGAELTGGTLVALGLLLPLGSAILAGTMLVAARTDHRGKGWFITGSGAELVITNAVVAIALAFAGGGRYSIDRAFGLHLAGARWGVAAAVLAIAAAGAVLAGGRRAEACVAGAVA
jgi:putative oxidoreductase